MADRMFIAKNTSEILNNNLAKQVSDKILPKFDNVMARGIATKFCSDWMSITNFFMRKIK